MRDTRHRTHPACGCAQAGFTLIELLIVVLIIGILASIALPSFLSQKKKADDAQAVSLARNAETAIESYGAANNGSYSNATVSSLNSIEPALSITSNTSNAYISSVVAGPSNYTVTVASPASGGSFTITKSGNTITHSCSGIGGGCVASTW